MSWLEVPIGVDAAINALAKRGGYFDTAEPGMEDMSEVVKRAQETLGVEEVDGVLGPQTWRAITAPKVCGVADRLQLNGNCRWPQTKVLISIQGSMPGLSDDDWRGTIIEALDKWNSVCGLEAEYTANSKTAHADIFPVKIDGRMNVLADSTLVPCGLRENSQYRGRQRYDISEPFHPGFTRPPAGKISLGMVCLHEMGHLWGLSHMNRGLLHASYQFIEGGFIENDPAVAEMVQRYGQPKKKIAPIEPRPPMGTEQKPLFSLGGWSLYSPGRAGDRYSLSKSAP